MLNLIAAACLIAASALPALAQGQSGEPRFSSRRGSKKPTTALSTQLAGAIPASLLTSDRRAYDRTARGIEEQLSTFLQNRSSRA